MKHAGPDALDRLSPLLEKLRSRASLREKRPGVFHLTSRAFLHFHEDAKGIFADVRLGEEFVRLQATSPSHQTALLKRIDKRLSSVSERPRGR